MDHELDLECILAFCNQVRGALGRQPVEKLRKGARNDPQSCVIANTINYGCRNRVFVDAGSVDWGGNPPEGQNDVIAVTPDCVAEYIDAFDFEHYPEFEGAGWIS